MNSLVTEVGQEARAASERADQATARSETAFSRAEIAEENAREAASGRCDGGIRRS